MAMTWSPKTWPQPARLWLEVIRIEPALVAARDELEEQVRPQPLQRQVADLVDDQQLRLHEQLQLLLQAVLVVRPRQARDQPGRGDKRSPKAQGTGSQAERHRQVGLAHARRPEQQHVVRIGQVAAGGQLADDLRLDARAET